MRRNEQGCFGFTMKRSTKVNLFHVIMFALAMGLYGLNQLFQTMQNLIYRWHLIYLVYR